MDIKKLQSLLSKQMARTQTEQELDYFAGNADGDGNLGVGNNHNLFFGLDKARKSIGVLHEGRNLFGGNVYLKKKETETIQALYNLVLNGPEAHAFICAVKDRTWVKRKQFQVASTFDMTLKVSVIAEKDEDIVTHRSITACARYFNTTESRVRKLLAKVDPQIDDWCLTLVRQDQTAVKASRDAVDKELRRLKDVPHEPITNTLSFAYVAGFFDAEGSISFQSLSTWKISVPQEHPEILFALQRQFGGSVFVSKKDNGAAWTLYARLARPLLENILLYLREKREQVEIILKFDPKTDDANEVRDRLSLLKGNVTPERKPLTRRVRSGRRQPQAVPVLA